MRGAEDIPEIIRAREVSSPDQQIISSQDGAGWPRRLWNHCQELQGLLKIRSVARILEKGNNFQLE